MKCARCGHDSKKSERVNRVCPGCKKQFAFEPKDGDPITDMLMKNAIEAISGGGRIKWGVEHLYYEVCRRKRGKVMSPLVTFGLIGAGASILLGFVWLLTMAKGRIGFPLIPFLFPFGLPIGGVLLFAGLSLARNRYGSATAKMDAATFRPLWDRWCRVHGTPAGVITRRPIPAPAAQASAEPDIADYSFDRAVIVDRARTVDLLIANNFHFENNCAVLSVDGYPAGPFATIMTMLKRNPKLQVYALHDASPSGCALATKVAYDDQWFAGKIMVVDLGLRPAHAKPFHGLMLKGAPGQGVRAPGISDVEAKWLENHVLELAAIRPEQTLKRLFHGMQSHSDDDFSTGGTTNCGSFESGSHSSSTEGNGTDGADSFG